MGFLLTNVCASRVETEVLAKGYDHAIQEGVVSLLHAGCIFSQLFQSMKSSSTEVKQLRSEIAELRDANSKCNTLINKVITRAAKEKIEADKKLTGMYISLAQGKVDRSNEDERIADLEAELEELEKNSKQELVLKDEALAAKDDEIHRLRAVIKAKEKILADKFW